jgi:hypothetical protein
VGQRCCNKLALIRDRETIRRPARGSWDKHIRSVEFGRGVDGGRAFTWTICELNLISVNAARHYVGLNIKVRSQSINSRGASGSARLFSRFSMSPKPLKLFLSDKKPLQAYIDRLSHHSQRV